MTVESVLQMTRGKGEASYAKNSLAQRKGIQNTQPIIQDTLRKMYGYNNELPECLRIAELGCSSGPNSLLAISFMVDAIHGLCQHNKDNNNSKQVHPAEVQVFVNDLPQNDFNTIFTSLLPPFYEDLKSRDTPPVFVSAVAGSFYGRLFPSKSIHFVHSSYAVHWLSQVPKLMVTNKDNVYIGKSSPQSIYESYLMQYQENFTTFLSLRSKEIIPGGCMVLSIVGRSVADPTNDAGSFFALLAKSLLELIVEGFVKESDLDSFNFPIYFPFKDEVKDIIEKEGSFDIERLEVFEVNWDGNDDSNDESKTGKYMANAIRSATEPLLASHFGSLIMDKLFDKYAKNLIEHLWVEKTKFFSISIALKIK